MRHHAGHTHAQALAQAMAAVCLSLALSGHTLAATVKCSDTIDPAAPVLSNGFGLNPRNTRNQASDIRASNVATLQLAYTHVAEGSIEKKSVPAVTRQVLYFSEGRDVVAANRSSGCEYWRFSAIDKSTLLVGSNAIRSSSIFHLPAQAPSQEQPLRAPMVYAGDFYGNYYGLDAVTGRKVWQAFMGTDASRHYISGSPQAHAGVLYIPVATKEVITTVLDIFSACCKTHGLLRAVNAYTGEFKWTYHATPEAVLDKTARFRGPSGVSIWSTPTIDTQRQQILITTAQNLSPPVTHNSDAVVAIDLNSGREKWAFQAVSDDVWNASCSAPNGLNSHCVAAPGQDLDIGAPPVLADLPGGGQTVLAGCKNGVVYALNPDTGALRWQRRVGAGGGLGGIHWGLALDRNKVYAAVSDLSVNKLARLSIGQIFTAQLSTDARMASVPNATPGIYALDLLTGDVRWQRSFQHTYEGQPQLSRFSAALSVTNDVLLAGSLDGRVYALSTQDGQTLWSHNTAVATVDVNGVAGQGGTIDQGGPIPVGRDVYVNSGYSSFGETNAFLGGHGNALFVFRLP